MEDDREKLLQRERVASRVQDKLRESASQMQERQADRLAKERDRQEGEARRLGERIGEL